MSLVQAIVTNDFVLIGAETKAIKPNGDIVNGCNKMIRVNKQIVFGCTGGIKDNHLLFKDFCKYSDTEGLVRNDNSCDILYNDFVNIITERFLKMYKLKHQLSNPVPYEIMSIVCGYNGSTFEATTFDIDGDSSNCICKVIQPNNFPYKGVNAGKIEHKKRLQFLVEENYMRFGYITLTQYKSILREVFKKGTQIDDTINGDIHIEVVKKKDVM